MNQRPNLLILIIQTKSWQQNSNRKIYNINLLKRENKSLIAQLAKFKIDFEKLVKKFECQGHKYSKFEARKFVTPDQCKIEQSGVQKAEERALFSKRKN